MNGMLGSTRYLWVRGLLTYSNVHHWFLVSINDYLADYYIHEPGANTCVHSVRRAFSALPKLSGRGLLLCGCSPSPKVHKTPPAPFLPYPNLPSIVSLSIFFRGDERRDLNYLTIGC